VAPVSESTSGDVRATVVRRILATTVVLEATVVGGFGVWLAFGAATQEATDRTAGIVEAVAALMLAAGLLVAALATLRGRRAARAPIIVWQILQAALAKDALTERSLWGAVLIVLSVVGVVGTVWPGVLADSSGSEADDGTKPGRRAE
jgi:hypothetical protein